VDHFKFLNITVCIALVASKQSRWKRNFFRWTAPSGFVAIILFLAIAVVLECLIIYSSTRLGLVDTNPLVFNVFSFTVSISLLFHLLPLSVIIVLFSSWIYLTRSVTTTTSKIQPTKPPRPPLPSRRYEKKSLKILRRFINKINKAIEGIGQKIKTKTSKTRLAQYLKQHIVGTAIFKSAWKIIISFSVLAFVIFLITYPRLIPNAVMWLFGGGESVFLGFITWTINAANAIGQTLSPLGWLAATINSGLATMAPGFRNAVIGLTTPIIKPLVELDLAGKYVLVQNVAAWFAAIIALYAGHPTRRRRR